MASPEIFDLTFSTSVLDRCSERRKDEGWIAACRAEADAKVLLLDDNATVPVGADGSLVWRAAAVATGEVDTWLFLGRTPDGEARFAARRAVVDAPEATYQSLREVGPSLDPLDADAAVVAVALTNWHGRHGFCAVCGAPTHTTDAGHVRHCDRCGADHFPRTDPAVIMLVTDGDRCVLGRRAGAPEGRWSTLAGFLEPGETPEAAVAREVLEEVGLVVDSVRYRGSQPWPFPSSLMLAYEASAAFAPLVGNDEHHEVRWFAKEELREGIDNGRYAVPGRISAGRALIASWLSS